MQNLFTYPDGRMDAKNAAMYLGLKEKTLAQWRYLEKGPPFIKRGKIFYFKEDLDTWLLQNGKSLSTTQAKIKEIQNERI